MNYIRELNAFRDWLMLNDLATSEVTLWYTLMSVDNMTGWQEWFTVPNSTLQQLAKLSKQGLDNARSTLKAKGLIDYRKGSRKQAGSYKITSLVNSFDQSLDRKLDQSLYQKLDQSIDQNLTITKHKQNINETKQGGSGGPSEIIDINFAKAIRAIESQFPARMNSTQIEVVSSLIADGLDPDIVVRSVEITRLAGKPITYLWGILTNCEERGIFTLAAFEEDREKWNRNTNTQTGKASYFAQKARELEHEEG